MTNHESQSLGKTVKGLFPQATPEEVLLAMEHLSALPFGPALAAIKAHRSHHDYLSHKSLREGIAAEHAKCQLKLATRREECIIHYVIRLYPNISRASSDLDYLAHHFIGSRKAIEGREGCEAIRKMIRGHARMALMEIGWGASDADAMASEWAGVQGSLEPAWEAPK